ncbi:MAG: amino acid adenylation domain-containing protein [Opitutae bacterium]|nr:amino acid adenylation domain-containing protein [Opitutae bacterium]
MSAAPSSTPEPIAVIGLAGRWPGARNIAQFWANLRNGVESIATLTDDQLDAAGVDPALRANPAYVKRRPLLDDVAMFDAAFFGYTPAEAARMDPQQRLFLETAWEALEHAGYDAERHRGAIGVFAGSHQNAYLLGNLASGPEFIEEFLGTRAGDGLVTLLGNDKDFLTSRVAYKLNLRGPAITVQSGCSTSLVAVVMACDSLRSGQTDVALAGGVAVLLPEHKGYLGQEGGMQSPDGHCRAFDAAAGGTIFGSGVGCVVLKRLKDALADGDTVHAVVKGAALNNDGARKVSYTAPAVDGQVAVIRAAQEQAGVSPDTIGYVEAHGTGTPLGDPIEVAALTQVFRADTTRKHFCALGSVKTNVGHLDAAAGITGFIKAVLVLREKQIPASLHFTAPNPRVDLAASPFTVPTTLTPWPTGATPRRAGVSAFGVGGTNAHVVLEEALPRESAAPGRAQHLFLLSARTPAALDAAAARLAMHLRGANEAELPDAAYTLQVGRREFPHRRMLVCADTAQAAMWLEQNDARHTITQRCELRDPPVVFLFPGQGAQYAGMGAQLYEQEPVFREAVAVCAGLLQEHLGLDVTRLLSPTPAETAAAEEKLTQTRFAQPALFTMEYALARLWLSWGVQPAAMIGHSLGEYVAATLAGIFPLGRALELVAERARLIEGTPAGGMMAVRLPEPELAPLLGKRLDLAAVNSPSLCVVSGAPDDLAVLEAALKERGTATIRLAATRAFHSAAMDDVTSPLARRLRKRPLQTPTIPLVSGITGRWLSAAEATDPDYWAQHARRTVRFADAVAQLWDEPRVLLEVGPGSALTTLARQHPGRTEEHAIVASLPTARAGEQATVLGALGRLWLAGVRPDWDRFHAAAPRRRVPLPTYPFERKRHWIEPQRAGFAARGTNTRASASPAAIDAPSAASDVAASREPAASSADTPPRRERLLAQLAALFGELSGLELVAADRTRSFVELGLDSLFLTQARQALQAKFGVKLTFRQLQEEAGSLAALADFIDRACPPEVDAPAVPNRAGSPPASDAGAGRAPELLSAPVAQERRHEIAATAPTPLAEEGVVFGERQRAHLADLTERLTARTRHSKEFAQGWRRLLVEPRGVANFRRAWKEMVYQIVFERSAGARLWDVDGNEYLDITMGWGTNLLGHSPAGADEAIAAQLARGIALGPQSTLAAEVAALVRELTGMDRVFFSLTGSDAMAVALRVARTVTGRSRVVFFQGAYHGAFDEALLRGGADGRARPWAPGIPGSVGDNALVLDPLAPASLETIRQCGAEIAAVVVEPILGRHLAKDLGPLLRELREITAQTGSLLVFDEVVTGFRVHPGGAQALLGVQADLVAYGKIIGGGLPLGALTGRGNLLDALDGGEWRFGDDSAPEASVTYHAGSALRHPLALAAARATLLRLREAGPGLQEELGRRTAALADNLNEFLRACGAGFTVAQRSSIFRFEFSPEHRAAPLLAFHLLARGIYLREPTQLNFLSTAHTPADVAAVAAAVQDSVRELQEAGFFPGDAARAAALQSRGSVFAPMPAAIVAEPEPLAFPLTSAQREIWVACQFGPEASCAFNEAVALTLRGVLGAEALIGALSDLVARHEALRTTFDADGALQRVHPPRPLAVPRTDWSHLGEEERAAHLAALTAQDMEEPFDLERGPLVRARLLKLGEQRHLLMFTAHHLVCDGETTAILVAELGRLYSARVQGGIARLDPPVPFRELAALQARQLADDRDGERFWLAQFAEPPPPLNLPLSRSRTAHGLHHGAVAREVIDDNLRRALKRLSARHGGTLFTLLLAAYQAWLLRLSGQDEIVVGVCSSARGRTGRAGVAGHAVNTLPLRVRAADNPAFSALFAQVNRLVLEARDHAEYTYGWLVERLQPEREPGRSPLLGALFNLERASGAGVEFHGLELTADPTAHTFMTFDLFLNARETAESIVLDLEYRADLFDPEVMAQWFRHFLTLLDGIASAPDARLAELPLLAADERRRMLETGNATALDYPRHACVHELFEARAEATPDAIALVAGGERISYAELNRSANRLANHLRAQGVGRDALVGVCLERSWRMVMSVLAVLKAGGAYVPLDPTHPADRLDFIRREARMRVIVAEQSTTDRVLAPDATDGGEVKIVCLDRHARDIARESAEDPGPAAQPAGLAYVLYTSGSTGRPKGVAIEHRNVVAFVHWAGKTFSSRELDGVLAATTITFDLSVFEIFAPLAHGGKVLLVPNVLALAELPEANEVRLLNTVPSAMAELLRLGAVPESVETVNLAGEPLAEELVDQLYALPHIRRVNDLYGPTEATVYATHALREAGAPATIGRPLANTQAYILDRHLRPVPVGVLGELFLGGEQLARGYLHQPGLTAEKFIRHPFATDPSARVYRTGDLCRFNPDGTIEFVGRIDHQVKIRGHRIEPGEIENVLAAHAAIEECVVMARDDRPGDRQLVAYVVPCARHRAESDGRELAATLRVYLQNKLPPYLVPNAIVPLVQLPRTTSGKLDRRALPAPAENANEAPATAPVDEAQSPLEESIAEIWRDVLGVRRVGRSDNFFFVGGHSLLAMRVVVRLREAFNIDLPAVALFTTPTVAGLAAEIQRRQPAAGSEGGEELNHEERSLLATG